MAAAHLATFILRAASGAIHPACHANVGALLPIPTAFIHLHTCTLIPRLGAATALNGILLLLLLTASEAAPPCAIGMAALTASAEILRKAKGHETLKGLRRSLVPLAIPLLTHTSHWRTDTEGPPAAAVREMPAGHGQPMPPVIDNIPVPILVLLLTLPASILAMRLAERVMKKTATSLK